MLALTAAPAHAGQFTINACHADRVNFSTRAFEDFATRGMACFYDVVLLDAGPGMNGPLARFAIKRADQVVLVTEPEWIASSVTIDALGQLDRQRTTVVLNKATASTSSQLPDEWVAIPRDERLALMLDSGTYSLEALDRRTRLAIKRLGLAVAQQLV